MFINTASADSKDVIEEHHTFGKLLRTKGADSDEGGVVAGFSVVDQPYLTDKIGVLTSETKI